MPTAEVGFRYPSHCPVVTEILAFAYRNVNRSRPVAVPIGGVNTAIFLVGSKTTPPELFPGVPLAQPRSKTAACCFHRFWASENSRVSVRMICPGPSPAVMRITSLSESYHMRPKARAGGAPREFRLVQVRVTASYIQVSSKYWV